MKKTILVGCSHFGLVSSLFAQKLTEHKIEIVTDDIEAKNIVNKNFETEPIQYISNRINLNIPSIKTNDVPRNKFIYRPLHNYKRR